jgi:PBS lyase HEAT-like repeat-containing protein
LLKHSDIAVVYEAVLVLNKIRDPRAIPLIKEVLEDIFGENVDFKALRALFAPVSESVSGSPVLPPSVTDRPGDDVQNLFQSSEQTGKMA